VAAAVSDLKFGVRSPEDLGIKLPVEQRAPANHPACGLNEISELHPMDLHLDPARVLQGEVGPSVDTACELATSAVRRATKTVARVASTRHRVALEREHYLALVTQTQKNIHDARNSRELARHLRETTKHRPAGRGAPPEEDGAKQPVADDRLAA
jgi:hypothetical protein